MHKENVCPRRDPGKDHAVHVALPSLDFLDMEWLEGILESPLAGEFPAATRATRAARATRATRASRHVSHPAEIPIDLTFIPPSFEDGILRNVRSRKVIRSETHSADELSCSDEEVLEGNLLWDRKMRFVEQVLTRLGELSEGIGKTIKVEEARFTLMMDLVEVEVDVYKYTVWHIFNTQTNMREDVRAPRTFTCPIDLAGYVHAHPVLSSYIY